MLREIAQRGLKRKAEQESELVMLRIVTCRSYPDYSKVTIEEKFIKQGAD